MLLNFLFINDLGNENEIRPLIHSTIINSVDENGNTALLLAAEKGKMNEF